MTVHEHMEDDNKYSYVSRAHDQMFSHPVIIHAKSLETLTSMTEFGILLVPPEIRRTRRTLLSSENHIDDPLGKNHLLLSSFYNHRLRCENEIRPICSKTFPY